MKLRLIISLFSMYVLAACNLNKNEPNIELMQDMMEQENIRPQEYDEFFKGGISLQVPPEHTVPVGFTPYPYPTDPLLAEKQLKNPFTGKQDNEVLAVGKVYFERNCVVCHGQDGSGKGPVQAKFPIPIPALTSDKVKAFQDGRIFHIITMGQGVMGAYASHIPQKYRWQVVNYVRQLQKGQ